MYILWFTFSKSAYGVVCGLGRACAHLYTHILTDTHTGTGSDTHKHRHTEIRKISDQ